MSVDWPWPDEACWACGSSLDTQPSYEGPVCRRCQLWQHPQDSVESRAAVRAGWLLPWSHKRTSTAA